MKTRPIDTLRLTHGLHWRTTNPALYPSNHVRTGFVRIALVILAAGWINAHWEGEAARDAAWDAQYKKLCEILTTGEWK